MLMTFFRKILFSPTSFFILVNLQLLQYSCEADAGSIKVAPMSQKVRLNDYANFSCKTKGVDRKWIINTKLIKSNNRTENGYIFEETIVNITDMIRAYSIYLSIKATDENNNTVVRCVAIWDSVTASDPAILIVKGKPSVPIPTLHMMNSSHLLLEWTIPFTWPDTNITGYKVSVNKYIGWSSYSVQENFLEIRLPDGSMDSTCTLYEFSVVASNELATGDPGNVTGGFPIAAQRPLKDNTISLDLTFRQNLSPILHLVIQLPVVCAYQLVEYVVVLKATSSDLVIMRGPLTLLYGSHPNISIVIDGDQLFTGQALTVLTYFTLLGLEQEFSSLQANKDIVISRHQDIDEGTPKQSSFSLKYIVLVSIICVAGVLVLVNLVPIVICQHRRKIRMFRSAHCKSPVTNPMVTNPTYEGPPVYDTINTHVGLALPIPPILPAITTAMTSASLLDNPYDIDPTPYGDNSQVQFSMPDQVKSSMPELEEECYTIMTPVKCKAKIPASQGSSSDHVPSDMPRYVPDPSLQHTGEY